MIEVLLVDDNPLIRDGIKLRLQDVDDIQVIGEVGDGLEALKFCQLKQPDLVLMDIVMPNMDGLETTKQLKESNPAIKVVILTSHANYDNTLKAQQYGCNGFIYKEAKIEDFISIIRSVNSGFDVWSSGLIARETRESNTLVNDYTEDLNGLNGKELELISCKVKCMPYSEIASQMNYSETYIRQLTVQLKEKLNLKNTNEIAVWGAKRGL